LFQQRAGQGALDLQCVISTEDCQQLDRHLRFILTIGTLRQPDAAHAAASQLRKQFIRPDTSALDSRAWSSRLLTPRHIP
jgi:hypothetical protein